MHLLRLRNKDQGWPNQQPTFTLSQFWRLQIQDQCAGGAGFFQGLPPPQLELGCPLPVLSRGLPSVCLCVLLSSSYKDVIQIGLVSTLADSFYLNCLFRDRVS